MSLESGRFRKYLLSICGLHIYDDFVTEVLKLICNLDMRVYNLNILKIFN